MPPSIADQITAATAAAIERMKPPSVRQKRTHVWASEWHPCVRNLYHKMATPDALPEHAVETRARFLRGEQREADVRHLIEMAGRYSDPPFTVEGTQERIEVMGRSGEPVITGRKDFDLVVGGQHIPSEVKSWPEMHKRIFTVDDLALSPWTRGAEMQILAYMYARNLPLGLLILDTQTLPRLIEVRLEERLATMERFLYDAETAVAAVKSGEPPPFINDPAECRRCPFFGRACSPPMDFGPGAAILTDEVLLQDLARRQELSAAATEYYRIDRTIKERLKGIPLGVAGDFLVQGKAVTRKEYTVAAGEYWRTEIKPLGGNGETA